MKSLFRRLCRPTSPRKNAAVGRRARLEVERLEAREVPAMTRLAGGLVLPHVEAQALYYGADWNTAPYTGQRTQLESYLKFLVNSSYMDMLGNAGYGVGRGSFLPGVTDSTTSIDKSKYMTDFGGNGVTGLFDEIQHRINDPYGLAAPDANRLYVVFLEDNVALKDGTSISNPASGLAILGYHHAFTGTDHNGYRANIHFAAIAYPGGTVNNRFIFSSAMTQLTDVVSHEVAEGVTDPDLRTGWQDRSVANNPEVGDPCGNCIVYLNGYAVQRIVDGNDQPMTPAGAAAGSQVAFVRTYDGSLYVNTSGGSKWLGGNVTSVSDQGIDNLGRPMVDVVASDGTAYEVHYGVDNWFRLNTLSDGWNKAISARAGQGVSYVLLDNGNLWEYQDGPDRWTQIDSEVTSIDAGTDRYGVNMVAETWRGTAYEWSDSTGWHWMTPGAGGATVASVSAGQQGILAFVDTNHNAYAYYEATDSNELLLVGSVITITVGTDTSGHYMFDTAEMNGVSREWTAASGWYNLMYGSPLLSLSKARAGVVDVVAAAQAGYMFGGYWPWGEALQHNPSGGWTDLGGSATAAM